MQHIHSTDRDYADMVNPYVRAEEEAYERGRADGYALALLHAGWLAVLVICGISYLTGAF